MSNIPLKRNCKECNRNKSLSEFDKSNHSQSGLRSYCRDCDEKRRNDDPIKCEAGEIWKAVVGWEGFYSVSNLGRFATHRSKTRANKVLTGTLTAVGYFTVTLFRDGISTKANIHVLVAEAFLGPRPYKHVTNHKDGVKTNNRAENLEWVTYSENLRHAYALGLNPGVPKKEKPSRPPRNKLNENDVREIRALRKIYTSLELGVIYKVHASNIKSIWRRESWAWVE